MYIYIYIYKGVDEMQFCYLTEQGTIDAEFVLRLLQEENHAQGKKFYAFLVDLENVFDRVTRMVLEWAMPKNGIQDDCLDQ